MAASNSAMHGLKLVNPLHRQLLCTINLYTTP